MPVRGRAGYGGNGTTSSLSVAAACQSSASPGIPLLIRSIARSENPSETSARSASSTSTETCGRSGRPIGHLVNLFDADLAQDPTLETVLRKVGRSTSEEATGHHA